MLVCQPAILATMAFETSAVRLWKRLPREDRAEAAAAFWKEPPQEALGLALGAIVKSRKLRPQVARSLSDDERARALAGVLDPGEPLAASLLVALHLGPRRPLLVAFLDALGLPHDNGVLTEEADQAPPAAMEAVGPATKALSSYPRGQIEVYYNTLWLQDPDRWAALEAAILS
jgi:hypothetical protein